MEVGARGECSLRFEGGERQSYGGLGELVLECRRLEHLVAGQHGRSSPKAQAFGFSSGPGGGLPEPLGDWGNDEPQAGGLPEQLQ